MTNEIIVLGEDIPLGIISALIVAANAVVCGLVLRYRNMRTFTNCFLVSLAVSDIFTGGLLFPLKIANVKPTVLVYLTSVVLTSGVGNLCGVTFDRFIAVTRPLQYSYALSKWFSKILAACWLVPLIISLLPLMWGGPKSPKIYSIYIVCLVLLGVILPYCGIFVAYFQIFKRIKHHNRHLSSVLSSTNKFQRRSISMEAKVSKVFAVVAVAFVLSWFPVIYMTLVYEINPTLIPQSLYTLSLFTIAIGSLANPVFYAFMKPDFKAALVQLVRRKNTFKREPRTITLQMSLRESQRITENINFHSSCRILQSHQAVSRSGSFRRSLRRDASTRGCYDTSAISEHRGDHIKHVSSL